MIISVTTSMIAQGDRCNGACCPLALAIKAFGYDDVMVVTDHVDFYDEFGGVCATLPLPSVAQRFVRQFDDNRTVEPFEFDMPGLEPGKLPFTHFRSVAVV